MRLEMTAPGVFFQPCVCAMANGTLVRRDELQPAFCLGLVRPYRPEDAVHAPVGGGGSGTPSGLSHCGRSVANMDPIFKESAVSCSQNRPEVHSIACVKPLRIVCGRKYFLLAVREKPGCAKGSKGNSDSVAEPCWLMAQIWLVAEAT